MYGMPVGPNRPNGIKFPGAAIIFRHRRKQLIKLIGQSVGDGEFHTKDLKSRQRATAVYCTSKGDCSLPNNQTPSMISFYKSAERQSLYPISFTCAHLSDPEYNVTFVCPTYAKLHTTRYTRTFWKTCVKGQREVLLALYGVKSCLLLLSARTMQSN